MEQELIKIFTDVTLLQLMALLAGSLFFAAVGFRSYHEDHFEALLYLALAFFFLIAHILCLLNIPPDYLDLNLRNPWYWFVSLLAPALIVLMLSFALFSFVTTRVREGSIKLFFGLTLFCYLFMLGSHWPIDVRGILTLIYSGIWISLEL
ncbi:MAG: hypothetical protein P1R58_10460, partial [bacterium]|nr:hypothetical protein [bacterium]